MFKKSETIRRFGLTSAERASREEHRSACNPNHEDDHYETGDHNPYAEMKAADDSPVYLGTRWVRAMKSGIPLSGLATENIAAIRATAPGRIENGRLVSDRFKRGMPGIRGSSAHSVKKNHAARARARQRHRLAGLPSAVCTVIPKT